MLRRLLLIGAVLIVATNSTKGQLLGTLETLPGLPTSSVQLFNKVIYSNGHDRPRVNDTGEKWFGVGIRPCLACPTIVSSAAGNVLGKWRFYTQYIDSWRGAQSNLSPCSRWTEDFQSGASVKLNLNPFTEPVPPYPFLVNRDPADTLCIWAQHSGSPTIKRVGRIPLSLTQTTWTFNTSQNEWDAIQGDGAMYSLVGNPYEPVSIGNDIFPACKYIAYHYGRLHGFGMANYNHPDAQITVTRYDDLTTGAGGEKDRLNGLMHLNAGASQTRVGTGYEVRRAKVTLVPTAQHERWGKVWQHSNKTYITLSPNGKALNFVIDGRKVARFTQSGKVWLRGTATEKGTVSPPVRTSSIEWDASRRAILLNVDVGPVGGPSSWEGGMVIDYNGNLTFDRKTTFSTWTGVSKPIANLTEPISFKPDVTTTHIYFLSYKVPQYPGAGEGFTNLDYRWNRPTHPTDASQGYFYTVDSIYQSASMVDSDTGEIQVGGYPGFNEGLMYKHLVVNINGSKLVGTVWDVQSPTELWLMEDYFGDEDITNLGPEKWEFIGPSYHFYSKFGYAEGGYFLHGFTQEGLGSFFWPEYEPGAGLTPMGMFSSPFGLEVLFREKSFLVSTRDTRTPMLDVSIERQQTRDTLHAPKSIATGPKHERISLVDRPKGIARSLGGQSQILTDASGNRVALAVDVNVLTSQDACATFFSNHRGDYYFLANMDRLFNPSSGSGQHALLLNMRDPSIDLTRIDNMSIRSLTTVQTDYGDDLVVYGDRQGNVGFLFRTPTDLGQNTNWQTRMYFSPLDLQPITITGVRLFAQGPLNYAGTGDYPYWITVTFYDVGAHRQRNDMQASITNLNSTYNHGYVFFDEKTLNVGKFMQLGPTMLVTSQFGSKPAIVQTAMQSGGFLIVMTGGGSSNVDLRQQEIYLKGLELQYSIAGDIRAAR